MKTVDQAVLNMLAEYDSATVQNAGILVRGFIPEDEDYTDPSVREYVSPGPHPAVGYALTSTWAPLNEQPGLDSDRISYFDSIARANVPVIVVQQDVEKPARRGAIIGDGMAYQMKALGAVGALVDGNARDVPGIEQAGLPLWATGRVPGHGPFNMIEHGIPVTVASLKIRPGDILVCDADGTTRVPVDIAADVAEMCAEVRAREGESHRFFAAPGFTTDQWEEWKARG
ncbi:MAG: RraA family protein [Dehalococcoidia bacterium]|jgi:regulator of RNase E activity RraA|nr:RraA family protein [Dehalococcoidia bacterium]